MMALQNYWTGSDTQYAAGLTPEIVLNADLLVQRVGALLERASAENIA